jgi:hypothetical protein
VKEQRDRTNTRILDMWMACHTNQEIADACGLTEGAIRQRSEEIVEKFRQNQSTKITFSDDFSPPLYNVFCSYVTPLRWTVRVSVCGASIKVL